jgi:hypothetical protein
MHNHKGFVESWESCSREWAKKEGENSERAVLGEMSMKLVRTVRGPIVLGVLLEGKNIWEYLGLFHVFCETWLTDIFNVLGGLMESVFRIEMYRDRKELRIHEWDTPTPTPSMMLKLEWRSELASKQVKSGSCWWGRHWGPITQESERNWGWRAVLGKKVSKARAT